MLDVGTEQHQIWGTKAVIGVAGQHLLAVDIRAAQRRLDIERNNVSGGHEGFDQARLKVDTAVAISGLLRRSSLAACRLGGLRRLLQLIQGDSMREIQVEPLKGIRRGARELLQGRGVVQNEIAGQIATLQEFAATAKDCWP